MTEEQEWRNAVIADFRSHESRMRRIEVFIIGFGFMTILIEIALFVMVIK